MSCGAFCAATRRAGGTAALLMALVLTTSCAEQATLSAEPNTERVLTTGPVIGLLNEREAHEWRGLPFAAPPLGENRWRPPLPPDSWVETRRALSFGNPCPQYKMTGDTIMGDEDCLFANVVAPPFTPDSIPREENRRPVMVWIHGGGNVAGHAAETDWSTLATEHGIVVISLQYRLGALGWFRHGALRSPQSLQSLHSEDASPAERSGNFALLDLVQGLHWVRDNAAAFGGDPGRITIFGASAGAANIFSLLISPLTEGLFHGAIIQSGGLSSSSITEAENPINAAEAGHPGSSHEVLLKLLNTDSGYNRPQAEEQLANMSQQQISTLLRSSPVEQLLATYPKSFGPVYRLPANIRDGHVLPAAPPQLSFKNGNFAPVPVLLGSARDEARLFMLIEDHSIQRLFGLPIRLRDPLRHKLLAEYRSRRWKARGVDQIAAAMNNSGHAPVFAYRTDWDEFRRILNLDFKILMGAMHGIELPFLQDGLDRGGITHLFQPDAIPAAQELGAAIRSYWAEFAYHGDPGRGRDQQLPRWRKWGADEDEAAFLVLDAPLQYGIRHSNKIESEHTLLANIVGDVRFQSECDRCDAMAGMVFDQLPDYGHLPQSCSKFFSSDGVFDCSTSMTK